MASAHQPISDSLGLAKVAAERYFDLPPNMPGNPEQLEEIYFEMAPEIAAKNPKVCMVAGSVAMELASSYGLFRPETADSWIRRARGTWEVVTTSHPYVTRRLEAQRYIDTVLGFSSGTQDQEFSYPQRVARTSAEMYGTYSVTANQGHRTEIHGAMKEQLVIASLGNLGLRGVVAYTSLARQKLANIPVDGMPYRWDVTVESDGTRLPSGQYFIQVTRGKRHRQTYHPDIIPVTEYYLSKKGVANSLGVYEAVLRRMKQQATPEDMTLTQSVVKKLVNLLESHSPSRSDTPTLSIIKTRQK